jgi:hypothetical protein
MTYPRRLSHLATRAVLGAKLRPAFAEAHGFGDEEAAQRLEAALSGPLLNDLLEAAWLAMKGMKPRLSEAELLDRTAETLADRPLRPGRKPKTNPAWSAFFVLADIQAGIASEAARRVMESEQGRRMAAEGLAEAGRHIAAELLRGR